MTRSEAFAGESIPRTHGILVVGAFNSGVEAFGAAFRTVAGMPAGPDWERRVRVLTDLNDRLLEALGGNVSRPPAVAPSEVAHLLRGWTQIALAAFADALGEPPDAFLESSPWIWADPRNSILAPFWLATLGTSAVAVLVHRSPADLSDTENEYPDTSPVELWDRYNRSALTLTAMIPTAIVSFRDLAENPGDVYTRVSKFLAGARFDTDSWQGVEAFVPQFDTRTRRSGLSTNETPHPIAVLDQLLNRMEAAPSTSIPKDLVDEIVEQVAKFYGADYYLHEYDSISYSRDEPHWLHWFGEVADRIISDIAPTRVLDVGCAIGLLVEALRERDVDAWGIDVSEWALAQVPEAIQPYCTFGSITDEFVGDFDLITCIEVLEHLPRSMADEVIGNLSRHSDAILFSSTPEKFEDPTHLNVESGAYWSKIFSAHGFHRDFDLDATFLSPQAVLYRRGPLGAENAVEGYERALQKVSASTHAKYKRAVEEHDALAHRYNELAEQVQTDRLPARLLELEARRSAEAIAATDTLLDYEHRQSWLARQLDDATAELAQAKAHIDGILQTRLYRYSWFFRKHYFLRRTAKHAPELVEADSVVEVIPPEPSYALWVQAYDTLDASGRARLSDLIDAIAEPPLISVLLPLYNTPLHFLNEAIDSVRTQIYTNWELCIVDDCSTDPSIPESMAALAESDSRIKFIRREENGHISAASNTALSMATGSWVACLDHDDRLSESALAHFALAIAESPDACLIYSDEDKISEVGERRDPFFKPEFDPLLLLGQNFLCHLTMYRKDLIGQAGGFRLGYEGSQDWDLALRVTADLSRSQIRHIPRILYHWRIHPGSTAQSLTAKSYAANSGEIAVRDHVEITNADCDVIPLPASGWNRVRWHLPARLPLVSIVIPTRDGKLLGRCIESIRNRSTYGNYEIIVVDNGSLGRDTLEYLRSNESVITVIRDDSPFNYPDINNRAVERSSGAVICLLNDDTEVLSADWLEELVGQLLQPAVGAVGAKLYYSNGQVQHAGVILGIGGVAGHAYRMSDRLSTGDHGRMQLPHELSAVTAACMVVRREAWAQVGGMDAKNLPVAFNDIDFCLRLREAGWTIAWTPFAELIHHESISRGLDTEGERAVRFAGETHYMKQRWGSTLRNDPSYNPNLTLTNERFELAWPPRVPRI